MLVAFDAVMVLIVSSFYDLYFLADPFVMALLFIATRFKPFLTIDFIFEQRISGTSLAYS